MPFHPTSTPETPKPAKAPAAGYLHSTIDNMLNPGLYEQVISYAVAKQLNHSSDLLSQTAPIDPQESSKVLAKHIGQIAERTLTEIRDNTGDISAQVKLVNKIVATIATETKDFFFGYNAVLDPAEQLLALLAKQNSIHVVNKDVSITRPETSVAHSSLFTGALHEPQMYSELKKEIVSCDRIDMLVSFVKWSGLRLIIEELASFTHNGGQLRVISTSYMGATDPKAIAELSKLPNTSIKISYDTKRTRLHAKTYVFHRNTGFTTAYVGSSNLSNAAMSAGLEWNVKITHQDLPETIGKIEATFESYWNSGEFEDYHQDQPERLCAAISAEKNHHDNTGPLPFAFDIRPHSYQQAILEKLEADRSIRGLYRNLVVAATGTGKTVISAFDYKRFKANRPGETSRLLFVAHREEILTQSLYTFRGVLKDHNFGEMFVGSYKPTSLDNLFMSIQTFNSRQFTEVTSPDYYDYIVVDEFHHAAAPTYQKLLTYYKPYILLGLTATPERMDGKSILPYFNNHISAEIRLPEAIDKKMLCPFQYFGVTDTVNLSDVKWSRGGYDIAALSNVYTLSGAVANRRAAMVIDAIYKYVTSIDDVKGLGFCVSIEHAKFMSGFFNSNGIPSMCLTGQSPADERRTAKERLVSGDIKFIFVVDIYNEGVDIPEVNTSLFLRPTESLTVFLQQFGRGLRLSEGKDCLTVLDFIGQAHRKYSFESKFAALLSDPTKSVQREVKEGFISAPKGCYIQLEKIAQKHVLDNLRASLSSSKGLIERMSTFTEDTGLNLTLANFCEHYHLDVRTIYSKSNFSRLCVVAEQRQGFVEPLEDIMTKAFLRLSSVDSRLFITFILDALRAKDTAALLDNELNQIMLNMLQFTIWQKPHTDCNFVTPEDALAEIKSNPVMCAELIELLEYKYNHIDFIDEQVDLGFSCPLALHCTYTRDQLLVALGFMKPGTVREGVKYLPDKKTDVFFITLNKSDKDYSPTTMYDDYSINDTLFHWQSQSTTSDKAPTGQRYINHQRLGNNILLFVREFKIDRLTKQAAPYTFLGTAQYVSHQGSQPMSIIWKLHKPIPAKFITKTNKLMAI